MTTHPRSQAAAIDAWIDAVSRHVRDRAPELAFTVDDYAGEARFGAAIIADELAAVPAGAAVLEVGAGAMFLSTALQAAGYQMTAIEPVGSGFSHMATLRTLVLDYARDRGAAPQVLEIAAENLNVDRAFDLAFSINVMEHVADVDVTIGRVAAALRPGAAYHFVCPNYSFPFEPHFGIPTLGTKALTWRVFHRRIRGSRVVLDPDGSWASLNWISVSQVRHICRRRRLEATFDGGVTSRFVQRALGDQTFQRRHGPTLRYVARGIEALGLARLADLVPVGLQPAMSCRVTRTY